MNKHFIIKDSEIPWVGTLPQHWKIKKLKHVVTFVSKKTDEKSNNRPYVGLENIESGTGNLVTINNNEIEGDSWNFEPGDILFGRLRPYLAKVFLASFSGRCSGELLVLRTKEYYQKFLLFLLLSDDYIEIVNSSTVGAKMLRAEWSFIRNMSVPIPEYNEQKIISGFLEVKTEQNDRDISKRRKLIELLQEKRQVIIDQIVTKGLNDNSAIRDSGIQWIGKIPEHWKIGRIKNYVSKIGLCSFNNVD